MVSNASNLSVHLTRSINKMVKTITMNNLSLPNVTKVTMYKLELIKNGS